MITFDPLKTHLLLWFWFSSKLSCFFHKHFFRIKKIFGRNTGPNNQLEFYMNKKLIVAAFGLSLVGCIEVQEVQPFHDFAGLEFSQRQDFNLPDAIQYFELRAVDLDGDPFGITPETIFQFDSLGYESLDIGKQIDLDMLSSTEGFATDCATNCPIYIASVGSTVSVVDSFDELKQFCVLSVKL